jgi:hypothetical protein
MQLQPVYLPEKLVDNIVLQIFLTAFINSSPEVTFQITVIHESGTVYGLSVVRKRILHFDASVHLLYYRPLRIMFSCMRMYVKSGYMEEMEWK